MKKMYLIAALCVTCSCAYALFQSTNADCSNDLNSVTCPCTPDCMPSDAWCTCPQSCSD